MESRVTKSYSDNNWNLLFDNTLTSVYTIYTTGRSLIYVYISDEIVTDFDAIDNNDIIKIGGILSICDAPVGKYTYVKAVEEDGGTLYYLPKGQTDPAGDVTVLYETLVAAIQTLEEHTSNTDDPHTTGVDYLKKTEFNSIATDIIPETPQGKFLLDTVAILLSNMITTHTGNTTGNPHNITKTTLGIDKVVNYAVATAEADILDFERGDLYATIAAVHTILSNREDATIDVIPNSVIDGDVASLSQAVMEYYDPESTFVTQTEDDIVIGTGLQVSYIYNSRSSVSNVLPTDITIPIDNITNTVSVNEGIHYLYVDINSGGNIESAGHTMNRPTFGNHQVSDEADFINMVTNKIYDAAGTLLTRVYISKLIVDGASNIDIVAVPRGASYRMQIPSLVSVDNTYEFNNPFIGPVEVVAELAIGDQWCDPKWNDQVGVMANFELNNPDIIRVQTGALGLAMPASSSGNGFTETNLPTTLTTSTPMRLIIRKVVK